MKNELVGVTHPLPMHYGIIKNYIDGTAPGLCSNGHFYYINVVHNQYRIITCRCGGLVTPIGPPLVDGFNGLFPIGLQIRSDSKYETCNLGYSHKTMEETYYAVPNSKWDKKAQERMREFLFDGEQ